MNILKSLFIKVFIGEKNRKYLGKYLLVIIVVHTFSNVCVDFAKGNEVSLTSTMEYLIITVSVMFVLFRVWIGIYEGTQAFWNWVLK